MLPAIATAVPGLYRIKCINMMSSAGQSHDWHRLQSASVLMWARAICGCQALPVNCEHGQQTRLERCSPPHPCQAVQHHQNEHQPHQPSQTALHISYRTCKRPARLTNHIRRHTFCHWQQLAHHNGPCCHHPRERPPSAMMHASGRGALCQYYFFL